MIVGDDMKAYTNRIKWLLGVGATLIYMAGLSLLISNVGSDALKIVINTLIGVALMGVSLGVEENFKLKNLGKYSFILSLLAFLTTFIYIGNTGMLGTYLSFEGDGAYVYRTFIFLLVALFAYITHLRYHDFIMTFIEYSALLIALFTLMCNFSANILANSAVVGVILLFFNIVKMSRSLNFFGKCGSLIYALITLFYLADMTIESQAMWIFGLIIVAINVVNLFMIIYKDRRNFIDIIAIVLLVLNTFLLTTTLDYNISAGLMVLIAGVVIAIVEILLNYLNVIENRNVLILFKIFINLAYLNLFSFTNGVLDYTILAIIIFGTSFINSYIYRHDPYEINILPLKLIFIGTSIFKLIDIYLIALNDIFYYVFLDLIFLGVVLISKNEKHRLEGLVLTLFFTYNLLSFDNLKPTYYVISGIIALLNYYVVIVRLKLTESLKGRIYYALVLFMILLSIFNLDVTGYKYLIASILFGILTLLTYNDRFLFAITLPALTISFSEYLGTLNLDASMIDFLGIALYYVSSVVWFNNLNMDKESKGVLLAIALLIISFGSLMYGEVLNTLLTIVVGVGMVYYGLKNSEQKAMHVLGIITIILALLSLTSSLGEVKAFIYLLIVGGGIIYFVIRLISKGRFEEPKEEAKEVISVKEEIPMKKKNEKSSSNDRIKYCYKCGNALNGDEKFCGKCGAKIQ